LATKLKPVRANAGLRQRYQKQLLALIDDMSASIIYWLQAQYREAPPVTAMDATPSQEMKKRFDDLRRRWLKRFDKAGPKIAKAYLKSQQQATDRVMQQALRDIGFTVKFKMTEGVRDAFNASLSENVGLIRNLADQQLSQVQGAFSRAYAQGKGLDVMVADLMRIGGVTRRRAANIALDQSNKANAVVERARRLEMGIEEAEWRHSGAGKHPRVEHQRATGRVYKVREGCPIKNEKGQVEFINPGEKPFCRCISISRIPGLSVLGVA
jgi:uncharacterized protein with gpF-like domain